MYVARRGQGDIGHYRRRRKREERNQVITQTQRRVEGGSQVSGSSSGEGRQWRMCSRRLGLQSHLEDFAWEGLTHTAPTQVDARPRRQHVGGSKKCVNISLLGYGWPCDKHSRHAWLCVFFKSIFELAPFVPDLLPPQSAQTQNTRIHTY